MADTVSISQRLAKALDDERIMFVVNGSILGYVLFILTVYIGDYLYSVGAEGQGLLMFFLLPAIWSVLPSFIFILKRFEMAKSAAIALSFSGFTPWVILNMTVGRGPTLVPMAIIFSLWSCVPLLALAFKDLKNRRPDGPCVFFLALFVLFYFVFLHPIPSGPSPVRQTFFAELAVSVTWALWLVPIPLAEYLLKVVARAIAITKAY